MNQEQKAVANALAKQRRIDKKAWDEAWKVISLEIETLRSEIKDLNEQLAKTEKQNKKLKKLATECYVLHSPATPRTKLSKSPAQQALTTKRSKELARAKAEKAEAKIKATKKQV
jgi:hypothetical protein